MQTFFLAILAVLIAFSQYINWSFSNKQAKDGVQVIYWVTDANPARVEQVALFRKWLSNRGLPDVNVQVDVNNNGTQKTIVQGVTGVAGDVIDTPNIFHRYFYSMGITSPVTDLEKRFGYPDSELYAPVKSDIFQDGKQIAFPCNMGISGLLVNATTFKNLGLPVPPFLMDFATFERVGKEFVTKAMIGRRYRDVFFVQSLDQEIMRRSVGVSHFNETLTGANINKPEFVKVLKLYKKWIYEDHLAPTAGEMSSFAVEHGYGGLGYQLLKKGNFGMVPTGRWAMIQMRAMAGKTEWDMVMPPHGGFPNVTANTRAVILYAGSKNREAAISFVGFLRSPEYNMHVVRDSDGIPPSPKYMDTEEYMHPVGLTNEWAVHAGNKKIANEYAFSRDISPFALFQKYNRVENLTVQGFINDLHTAEETARRVHEAVEDELARYMKVHPDQQAAFAAALEKQKKIDAIKASGKKIPLAMVDNPFLKAYYTKMGLGE